MSSAFVEYQLFPESYFSGCDVSLYIGEEWVDEVTSLEFSVQEQVQPIYGYNSYTFDACARGSRTIQGSFGINFKEANYLNSILEKYNSGMWAEDQFLIHPGARVPSSRSLSKIEIYRHSPEELEKDMQNMTDEELRLVSTALGSRAGFLEESALLKKPYFNIAPLGFDIVIVYGIPTANYQEASSAFHKIIGVQLVGCQQVVSPEGNAIFEQYGFIARDLN